MIEMNKNRDNVLIIFNSIPYFLDYFNRERVKGNLALREISLPLKVIRKISRWLKLPQNYWFENWKNEIDSFDTVIIFAPLKEVEVLEFIKSANKNIRIIYWYWNPVFRMLPITQNHLRNVEVWSFDPEDCRKFGMNFNTTFYFKEISLVKNDIQFDAVFVGNDKGRGIFLKELEAFFSSMGLKTYFHVIPDIKKYGRKHVKRIPYKEYLTLLSKTKAIIDIIPDGQSGLTVRSMESIFHKKKLITTDLGIVNQDFYNKENIFIIGKDDQSNFKSFLNSPYIPISTSIVNRYNLNGWLQRFNIE